MLEKLHRVHTGQEHRTGFPHRKHTLHQENGNVGKGTVFKLTWLLHWQTAAVSAVLSTTFLKLYLSTETYFGRIFFIAPEHHYF